jgi:hypothetical protein
MAEPVFQFISDGKSACKIGSIVCLARHSFVTEFISFSEFKKLFGGYILSDTSDGTSYSGVWSRRVCGRFRQLLRDRGASIEIIYKKPAVSLRQWGTYYEE